MTEPGRGRSAGRQPGGRPRREPRILLRTAVALALAYLGLRFGLPWLAVWVGASEVPAPVPVFAMAIYMLCAGLGALVWVGSDDRRWHRFLGPLVRLLVLPPGRGRRLRLAVLGALPLLVGWGVWRGVMPGDGAPGAIRLQHPTQPEEYARLENPLREAPESRRRVAERAGTVLYQKNCRPCHGAVADGSGPLASGLRLRPVDFTDPGTIASVVESYPFWRIREGHRGLPDIATPWNSAMPAWKEELEDEEIWRTIMAEYRISGTEPRIPEELGR